MCQLTDIWSLGSIYSKQIEEFFYLCQVFQLYLFDEENIDFRCHVHGLEQVFTIVGVLAVQWIEPVLDVSLEVLRRTYFRQYLLYYVLVVVDYLVEGIGAEIVSCLDVQELSERETSQVVALHYSVKFGIFILQPHHA